MTDQLRTLLAEHDDAIGCERPSSAAWDRASLAASLRSIRDALRTELALAMDLEDQVEDASFNAELTVMHPKPFHVGGGSSKRPRSRFASRTSGASIR